MSGYLISTNLLLGQEAFSIDTFDCSASIPTGNNIKVQFSQDLINWYNSSGVLDAWDILIDGRRLSDLSLLGWQGANFYYHMNFTSDDINAPSVQHVVVFFTQYPPTGNLVSQSFDASVGVNWTTISWTKNQTNDDIKFQLRSASSESGLSSENFVGPDGTGSTYYETSGAGIWNGHDSDQWIQYKAYLGYSSGSDIPILKDVAIFYNHFPMEPELVAPVNDIISSNSTPLFSWDFFDSDGSQGGFQVLIDDDIGFGSVDYDGEEQSSTDQNWQFPEGTGYAVIADGTWYWKVRTRDNDGDWGPYCDPNIVTIDATPPSITHLPVTSGTTGVPINITAIVTEDGSGIETVKLYYKKPTETSYAVQVMTAEGNIYSAEIPGTVVTSEGLEYYIEAKDNADPSNILYFNTSGNSDTEPDTSNDIDITITGADSIYPSVIDWSPRGSKVSVDTTISVAFSEPMDQLSTQDAFSITPYVNGVPSWLGTTLTFTPESPLAEGTQYNVTITTQARNSDGIGLQENFTWSFITGGVKEKEPSFWETWEPIITLLTILISVFAFVIGFLSIRKKRGKLHQYLERIDDTFNEYKKEYQTCEKELITLREGLKGEVKKGKLDENHFLILDKKIDDYLREMKSLEKVSKETEKVKPEEEPEPEEKSSED